MVDFYSSWLVINVLHPSPVKVPIFPLQKWLQRWIRLEVWKWPRLSWPGAILRFTENRRWNPSCLYVVLMSFSEENQLHQSFLGTDIQAMPRTLRKVLRNAMRRGILSDNTLMVLQGREYCTSKCYNMCPYQPTPSKPSGRWSQQSNLAGTRRSERYTPRGNGRFSTPGWMGQKWVSDTGRETISFEDSLMSFLFCYFVRS